MKKLFLVANWKSNKTGPEAKEWLRKFQVFFNPPVGGQIPNKEIIVCPSFTLLSDIKLSISNNKLPIGLGAQDISPFDEGSHTGEINGKQIKEFADFVIIGHSERRRCFSKNQEMIQKKLEQADKYGLSPILCISDLEQIKNLKLKIKNSSLLIAYEPLFAIGSGNPDTPENANEVIQKIKKELNDVPVLYGGSVNVENVALFTQMPNIDGVLVGKASLDANEFLGIIKNA